MVGKQHDNLGVISFCVPFLMLGVVPIFTDTGPRNKAGV